MKRLIIVFLILLSQWGFSQVPIGQWTAHITNNQGLQLCEAGDKIYCVTRTGVFYFNQSDNSVHKIGKIEGLLNINTNTIHYNKKTESIYIGFNDGTISIINSNNQIYNLQDITRKSYPKKIINKIREDNDKLYLCTGFGIAVFDPERLEFMETYIIGDNGYEVNVKDICFDEEYIYAATDKGIKKAKKSSLSLANYQEWERITNIPLHDKRFNAVVIFDNKLIANYESKWYYHNKVIVSDLETGSYHYLMPDSEHYVQTLHVVDDKLMLVHRNHISLYNHELNTPVYFTDGALFPWGILSFDINDALVDKNGNLWYADNNVGMVRHNYNNQKAKIIKTNTPKSNSAYYVTCKNKTTWLANGRLDVSGANTWTKAGISRLQDGRWRSYSDAQIPTFSEAKDIIAIEQDPNNSNKIYCCSATSGVLEINVIGKKNISAILHNDTSGSTLTPLYGHLVKVVDAHLDKNMNLWTVSPRVKNPISVKKPSGDWETFHYGNQDYDYGRFIIAKDGAKWILTKGKGLFVFNENRTIDDLGDDFQKHVSVKDKNGDLISNDVYSIAQDKDNQIWVGTNDGIAVFYSPRNIYKTNNFYASRIIIDINGKNEYLMKDKKVTAIAVDGANRKWIGTQKSGVFLISEDGTEQFNDFNTDNSPLPSNEIKSISIDNESGEVFIATGNGLMSYRAEATEGNEFFKDVYTFPNPVEPDYRGPITITGLVENTIVKITDIAGNIVTELKSLGGQAIWDGKNLNGNRVSTGVYLVLLSSEDGEQKAVTKILFVN